MRMSKRVTYAGVGLAAALMTASIVRAVTAGPQTIPQPKDIAEAARTLSPKVGADERQIAPEGQFVAGAGVIEPADREIKLAGDVAGRVAALVVKEGDRVKAGDPVVKLESALEAAALQAADADVSAAKAELLRSASGLRKEDVDALEADEQALKAKADLSAKDLERVQGLADKGAISAAELDQARTKADADRAALSSLGAKKLAARRGRPEDVAIARARLSSAIARREQQQRALDRLTVRAPIEGEILQLKVRPGEYYAPGQPNAEPLAVIGDTRRLRARVDVDERDVAKVKVHARALITLLAYPDKRFEGEVVEIGKRMGRKNVRTDDPTERNDTKILEVVIELTAPDGLIPGERVTAYVERGQ